MKARFQMRCACCRSPISTGDRYERYAGRPWITAHLIAYKRRRATMK